MKEEEIPPSHNPLTSDRVGLSLIKLSVPAIAGMMISALYNIVDAAFVGRGAGPLAIGGLTVVFPIQMLIMSLAQIFGIGAASMISRAMGMKNREEADRAAGNAVFGASLSGIICMIAGYIFMVPLLKTFGATGEILTYGRDYFSIILAGSVFVSYTMSSTNLARAEGKAMGAMFSMLIGTVLNIILDPLFIFTFNMGIKGAAWATVISQAAGFIYLILFFKTQSRLRINFKTMKPEKSAMKEMIALGMPTFVRHGGGSLLALVINNTLRIYGGNMAIAAYGTLNRILMFGVMPVIGFNQGLQPLVGYNFTAGRMNKVKETVKWGMINTTAIAALFSLTLIIMPGTLIRIFSSDRELLAIAVPAARIIALLFSVIGIQSIGSSYFQAVGKARPAFFLGISRQLLALIPLVLILPPLFGLKGIWFAFPMADLFSTLVTVLFLARELRYLKSNELQKPPSSTFD